MRKRTRGRESVWCRRVGGVTGVPDEVHVVADLRDPVEAKIEIDATVLVVELNEAEEGRASIERIFNPPGERACHERSSGELRLGARAVESEDHVPSSAPRSTQRRVDAGAVIKAAEADNAADTEGSAQRCLVLEPATCPPVPTCIDADAPEDGERLRRRIHRAHDTRREGVTGLKRAAEHLPCEVRRLPRAAVGERARRARYIRDDVPARNRRLEIELTNA